MPDILEQLRAEHSNMAKLLNVLERQIAVFGEGGKPDYEVVQGVVQYFLDYPEQCHHPKEDLVARRILEDGDDTTGPLRKLEAQHEELGALTQRFAGFVERVLGEAELPRNDFMRSANEFIASQRHHMQMEEEYFFPLAEGALNRGDLEALGSDLLSREDPLMDPDLEAHYAALRDNILAWEAETPD